MNNKLLNNAKWIIVCKVVQSLVQFFVGMLSARYLGPSNYGLINYAASIVAFAVPIMQLGLPGILVREYVEQPEKESVTLGTALVMNMVSAVACIIGVTAFSMVANRGEPTTILVCMLYSTSLFFQAIEMLQYWYQARLLAKYSSLAMLCSYVVVSAYKIYLLVAEKDVHWFALSHAVEYGVTGLLLLIIYKRNSTQKLCFSVFAARAMFAKSKYYITSSLLTASFSSIAGILMKVMIGTAENGYFSAAVTCTAVAHFVYAAIIDSARPVILESKKVDLQRFEKNVSRLYCVIIYLSLVQSVAFTMLARLIVKILYGQEYLASIPVLQILVWQTAFSYMGSVRNIWILAEEKHSVLWIINLGGAIASTLLNFLLIPAWGACGAALASVVTQIFTNVIMGYLLKPVRRNNDLLVKGLNPKLLLEMLPMLVKGK